MAILAVVTAVAICMVIVNEFGTRTTIDMLQARNNLDQMRAELLARSSLNLTDLVLRLQRRLDNAAASVPQLEGIQITDFADSLMAAFGGDAEQVEAAIGVPIADTKGLGVSIGSFGVRLTPIDGKININCAASRDAAQLALVRRSLEALFYPNAFDPVFQEADSEGWRRDRKTQVDALMDYVDPNFDRADTPGAPEDYGYEGLRDPYKAKNRAIDSVAELKLVRGVDDRLWTLFGSAFRVAGDCKINLRARDDAKIIAGLITLAAKPNDPVANDLNMVWTIANLVLQAKQYGFYFNDVGSFVEFVKDPAAAFAGLAGDASGQGGSTGATPPIPNLPPGLTGIELDAAKLNQIAASTPVRVYDVEVYGEVARGGILNPLRRTLHATWDQELVLSRTTRVQPKLPPGKNSRGGWLYLREE
ncbi:MAG: type II secretion system protein GspK [Kofleriaceae bacterium]